MDPLYSDCQETRITTTLWWCYKTNAHFCCFVCTFIWVMGRCSLCAQEKKEASGCFLQMQANSQQGPSQLQLDQTLQCLAPPKRREQARHRRADYCCWAVLHLKQKILNKSLTSSKFVKPCHASTINAMEMHSATIAGMHTDMEHMSTIPAFVIHQGGFRRHNLLGRSCVACRCKSRRW